MDRLPHQLWLAQNFSENTSLYTEKEAWEEWKIGWEYELNWTESCPNVGYFGISESLGAGATTRVLKGLILLSDMW
jgi:hypothetical protein